MKEKNYAFIVGTITAIILGIVLLPILLFSFLFFLASIILSAFISHRKVGPMNTKTVFGEIKEEFVDDVKTKAKKFHKKVIDISGEEKKPTEKKKTDKE